MCSHFLWGGTETKKCIAKVAWNTVCLPKREGGLGDSLWANWIREYRIKNKNFWSLDAEKATSSTWKALLSLRGLAAHFIRAKMGNGQLIIFWFDYWTPLGPLIHRFGVLGPRELSIPLHCLGGVFYHWLATPWAVDQIWTRSIWFKGHVPRQAFTSWIDHQDRLPTRMRLSSWGMNVSPSCCLCGRADETRTHLFLHCETSEAIWDLVLSRLGYSHPAFHTWLAFAEWTSMRDSVTSRTLKRLLAQATISSIWTERNKRLHDSVSRSPAVIFKKIDHFIIDVILGKRKLKHFQPLMQLWLRYG
ncbi:hypothetical protein N665_0089s0090 [Sinapis alba]|nr:hypothetical protein N665_0089s0090 [Sinapis alba]